jgi:hypothetical protein
VLSTRIMKHRALYAASIVVISSLIACSSDAPSTAPSGSGEPAIPKAADTPATSPGTSNGAGSSGNDPGPGSIPAEEPSAEDNDAGVDEETDSAAPPPREDGGAPPSRQDGGKPPREDGGTGMGNKPDAGPGAFGAQCKRDSQCASGVCARNGKNDGYCSIQCTDTNAPTICTKPLTSGKCKNGFCGKP